MGRDGVEIEDTTILSVYDVRHEGMNRVMQKTIDIFLNSVTNMLDFVGNFIGTGIPINDVNAAVNSVLGYDSYVSNGFSNAGKGGGTIYIAMFPEQIRILNVVDLKERSN